MADEGVDLIKDMKQMVEMYGVKRMAYDLDKRLSSLYGELAERDWAKLGLSDFLLMVEKALSDDAPPEARGKANEILDKLNYRFDRISFPIPPATASISTLLEFTSYLSSEYSEIIMELAEAMKNNRWTLRIINSCIKENQDLIRVGLEIDSYMKRLKASSKGRASE